ncbi:MAG: Gfo/Idh/MocA family protein [Saccharofermentanales bacterium]
MIDSKYAVAIIGFGGMGNWHRELLGEFDRLTCAGTFDIKPERQKAAADLGLHAYESLDEVLNDKNVDIVLISTPNDSHKPIAIRAMRAGKAVVSEKPVTLSSSDLQEMIDCAVENKVLFTVHQNRRWDEDYLIIKRICEENLVGEIFNIESRVEGSWGIPGGWRSEKEHGGGMVLDWGVHILDQILQMFPEKIIRVFAKLDFITNSEVDDGFVIFLTFESGKTALLEVGTSNFITLPRWYLQGINGTAVIDDFSAKGRIVRVYNWDKREVVPVKTAAGLTKTMAPRNEDTIAECALPAVKSDIHDFYNNVADVIEGKALPLIKHNELMRCMKLMEAVFESDRLKQVVDFE